MDAEAVDEAVNTKASRTEISEVEPPQAGLASGDAPAGVLEHEGRRKRDRAALLLYITALTAIGLALALDPYEWRRLLWQPRSTNWLLQVGLQVTLLLMIESLAFAMLGFLTGRALAPLDEAAGRFRALGSVVAAFFVASVIAIATRTLASGAPFQKPSIATVGFLAAITLWSAWLGVAWTRRTSTARWLAKGASVSLLMVIGTGAVVAWLGCASEPWIAESKVISSKDRTRLIRLLRDNNPRRIPAGEIRTLELTETDINQLSAWGLSVLPGRQAADFNLEDDDMVMVMSVGIPPFGAASRFLNLRTSGSVMIRDGELGFRPRSMQLGRLKVPESILRWCGPVMVQRQWQNHRTAPFFHALHSIDLQEEQLRVSYSRLDIEKGFVRDALVGLGLSDDLEPATAAHVTHLISLAEKNPALTFEGCVEAVFAEAHRRSRSKDAVHENRAAIAALGYLIGHPRIRSFVGSGLPIPSDEVEAVFRRTTVRGRRDWARHFCVSAALQVLGNTLVSKDVGLFKEELDSFGGSGFSFGDLLADRAGTKLAELATESADLAERVQARIAGGFRISDVMPPASDLPEGLTAEEFQRQYGGTRGKRYQQLLEEIDRRIENCDLYRSLR